MLLRLCSIFNVQPADFFTNGDYTSDQRKHENNRKRLLISEVERAYDQTREEKQLELIVKVLSVLHPDKDNGNPRKKAA
jgi:hypothetical protein